MRVLVVDDEPAIRQLVSRALVGQGHSVDSVATGAAGLERVAAEAYDVVVLDVVMPGSSGIDILPKILALRPDQNVVMLSALSDPRIKVQCLELGAVDYVTKPFTIAELVARLRIHSRRAGPGTPSGGYDGVERRRGQRRMGERRLGDRRSSDRRGAPTGGSGEDATGRWIRTASASLDVLGRRLYAWGGVVPLSERETLLLACLLRKPGEVCTREELLESVWGSGEARSGNVLDVYVGRLRAKLPPNTIQTVRNVGYAFLAS